MAEGSNLNISIKDSDADFDFTCTPCGEDKIREEAVKYCPECQEHLCVTCARHHGRQKATRSHKLLDKSDTKQGSSVTMTAKCRYHPDREIEMYCGTHDMVYCAKCIATEHRSSCEVTNIEDVPKRNIQSQEVKHLLDETQTAAENLKSIGELRNHDMSSLEEQRSEVLQQMQEMERSLTEHIWKLKREATESLNKNYEEIKSDLESESTMITNSIEEAEESKQKMLTISSLEAGQQFVQKKLIQRTLLDAKKLFEESGSKKVSGLSYVENSELITSVMKAMCLGQIRVVTEGDGQCVTRQYKLKAKKDVKVALPDDSAKCLIADVCQLQDGTVILADRYCSRIKRLDKNFNVKDYCDLESSPFGVCCTGQNEIAVKMNKKIQFIYVGTVFSKLRDISVDSGVCYGIAYCGGELWVSTRSGVIVYSTTGKFLKSIVKDSSGKNIFKGAAQHMAVSEDAVLVTDCGDGAVCLEKDGSVRQEFRDGRLSNAKGVCLSDSGIIFITGNESNNIVMFSKDGKCLGELVGADMGLTHPLSLCYDKNNLIFLTHCQNCEYIRIVEIGY